ncbi:hypothetical protein GCM10023347_04690 [Streptomyces chumphonensis]
MVSVCALRVLDAVDTRGVLFIVAQDGIACLIPPEMPTPPIGAASMGVHLIEAQAPATM